MLKLLSAAIERMLGVYTEDKTPRADMCLTEHHLSIAIVLLLAGAGSCIVSFISAPVYLLVIGAVLIVFGIACLLCWRNQTIRVLNDREFEYTTFLGHTRVYAFDQITALRRNRDSLTLFVGGDKVHIEASAIISDRLAGLLNAALGSE